jgi:uroporphyrinogen-III synthase
MGASPPVAGNLAGHRIVVTRPAAQAEPFCARLEQSGASVFRFPVIAIEDPSDRRLLQDLLTNLDRFDLAVFVSTNAVERFVPRVLEKGPWPASLRIGAIGARTAQALAEQGTPAGIVPARRFDSEALLAEPALQDVRGWRVVIVRGEGGRDHLAAGLRERGAEVTYAEAYRRALPETDAAPLGSELRAGRVDALTVTSGESLRNLVAMISDPDREALLKTPLVVGAERVAEFARELGFRGPIVTAEDPTDAAMLEALRSLLKD